MADLPIIFSAPMVRATIGYAYGRLFEIDISNYDHDGVCLQNGSAIEVILGLKDVAEHQKNFDTSPGHGKEPDVSLHVAGQDDEP